MKERPIIFNSEMVKAILGSRKTQTRRVIKPQPIWHPKKRFWDLNQIVKGQSFSWEEGSLPNELINFCPYGKIGDRLWVRETWCNYIPQKRQVLNNYRGDNYQVIYKASHKMADMEGFKDIVLEQELKWKPSIFMPRWASRINLEITDIRVERVQDITPEDCEAEGIVGTTRSSPVTGKPYETYYCQGLEYTTPTLAFKVLWGSINYKRGYGWEVNPYVWIIEFKVA